MTCSFRRRKYIVGLYSIFALLFPSVIYVFINGISWRDHDSTAIEFIRVSGVMSTVISLISYLSIRWGPVAKQDVFRVISLYYILVTIVSTIILSSGGTYMWALVTITSAALGFVSARVGQLF